jgi:hypothetical protein
LSRKPVWLDCGTHDYTRAMIQTKKKELEAGFVMSRLVHKEQFELFDLRQRD